MSKHNKLHRMMALLLTLAMLLSVLPMGVFAAEGETVKGESTVIDADGAITLDREINFNKDWKFYLGNNGSAQNQNFNDSGWESVDLPHDFSIIQEFSRSNTESESGFLPGGTGWYRKTFVMPAVAADKSILLNFDGVYMHAYVYVNGQFAGEHHYGYSNFAIDITDYLTCDGVTENVIAVKAVNQIPSSRWYSGSGIYRDVTLIVTEPVHVDWNGTKVTTPDVENGGGTVNVAVDVVNDGDADVTATVKNTIYAKGGETALATQESSVTVAAGATATASNAPVVNDYKLWSTESPNLYTVKTEVLVDGKVVDTYETEFGFRWFTFSSTGFALNGQNLKLNGVCMHHDQGAAGSAAYYDAIYRQMSTMKDMGCNAIRTTHNPASRELIAACNELGLLVIEESFDGLTLPKNGNSNDFSTHFQLPVDTKLYGATEDMLCSEYSVKSIVKRDRNAACIFAWSYGNEIQEGTSGAVSNFVTYCEKYIQWVNSLDGTRFITSGDNNRGTNATLVQVINTITSAGGVAGFNYHLGNRVAADSLVSRFGGSSGSIIASETASATNSRGQYRHQKSNTQEETYQSSYDTSAVGWGTTAHDSIYDTYTHDNVAGEFVWTGFDYIGEPTPYNDPYGVSYYPINSSYFGIVETTGFEKDTYYLYRSQWNKQETTLHLVTAWDSDNMVTTDGKTPVWVYSNAPVVKLYRNGELIGTATRKVNTTAAGHVYYTYTTESENADVCTTTSGSGADGLYAIFNVTYEEGTISAKAFQKDGTTEIALTGNSGNHTVATPGALSKLAISQNRTEAAADGSSLIYVEVDVTDANGNLDTTADNTISFQVEGPGEILGVDNGDQATTAKFQSKSVKTSDTTAQIKAFAGKALAIIRTTEEAGTIQVTVSSDGLTGGTVVVNTSAVDDGETGSGLSTYTMVRDYSVHDGVKPTLETTASGTMADGSAVSGTIVWETVTEAMYTTPGDHTLKGQLTFDGLDPIVVTARLHVIPNVIAVRNVSAATLEGEEPTLPATVRGVMPDGTLAGEFPVVWDTSAKTRAIGDTATIHGVATILGKETMDVTCTVRVAEGIQGEKTNIAPAASKLEQDIAENMQSDVLESIIDEVTNPGEASSLRWTNWNNRYTSDIATITMAWDTAHGIGEVNLYYRYDNSCAKPASVVFAYSADGNTFKTIEATESALDVTITKGAAFKYTFDEVVSPVALKITFTQQGGTTDGKCVGLYEAEVMSYLTTLQPSTTADLTGISVDGTAVTGFSADTLNYLAPGSKVTATAEANVGYTVLPVHEGVVRILTVSEDGSTTKTYSVIVDPSAVPKETVEVSVKVGETKTIKDTTGDYTNLVNREELDEKIASVTVTAVNTTAGKQLSDAITQAPEDGKYILVNTRANKPMETDAATVTAQAGPMTGLTLNGSKDDMADKAIWTLTKVSDGTYTVQSADGKYLTISNNNASLENSAANISISYNADGYWTLSQNGAYLNDGAALGTCATGWDGDGSSTDGGSRWTLYPVTITLDEHSTVLTIEGKDVGNTSLTVGNTIYKIDVKSTNPATLTLDFNDGITEKATRNLTVGDTLGQLPVPTRKSYNFVGWFNGDVEVTAETIIEQNMTITAKWEEKLAVIDLRNVSTVTRVGEVPTLPETVRGVLADGTLAGDFTVTWGEVKAEELVSGAIVTVTGTVVETDVNDKAMDVTCTIRVADAAPATSTNVAPNSTLSQDCELTSDVLESIVDGVTDPQSPEVAGESSTRWSNYNNLIENHVKDATITLTWDSVQPIREIALYFRIDDFSAQLPSEVAVRYSTDGVNFEEMDYSAAQSSTESLTYGEKWVYALDKAINAKVMSITFTSSSDTNCVSLYEIETYTITDADDLIYNATASLSKITSNGTALDGFASNVTGYEVTGKDSDVFAAETSVNAGITILPAHDNVVRILTVSEDGNEARTYEITLTAEHICTFDQTIATDAHKATAATCTAKATYYKSCSCGKNGTETFESGEKDLNNHTGTLGEWKHNESSHWKEYSCCGAHAEEAAHSGGNATCTAQAECSTCGEKYGDLADHVYDQEVATDDHKATDATCTAKATYYKSCSCGANGTETFESGEKDLTNHTGALGTEWKHNEANHWKEYSCCGTHAEEAAHSGGNATCTEQAECSACGEKYGNLADHTYDQEVATDAHKATDATCTAKATYYKSCSCGANGTETFESGEKDLNNHTGELGDWQHNETSHWKEYSCCGTHAEEAAHKDEDGNYVCDDCQYNLPQPETSDVIRLEGSHRHGTAIKTAEQMKEVLGVEKFDAIIVAYGYEYYDALAGSYLSAAKSAPILLSYGVDDKYAYLDTDNIDYIKENLAENGTVYILGGESAVPALYETELSGYNVTRLGGDNRFETNLMILNEAGIPAGSEILVCTATNFADCLSAAATGKPILLVWNERGNLYGSQPDFLKDLENCTFTIIGGEAAVSDKFEEILSDYGTVDRVAGDNRLATSVEVAKNYFQNADNAVLAWANNFPDGLCGGALAYAMKSPLILTNTQFANIAADYTGENGITTGIVLGGESQIADSAVREIFTMADDAEITRK